MTNITSTAKGMRLRTIATLFAVSAVILTGSPAFATQLSRHETRGQDIQACDALGACSPRDVDAQHHTGSNMVPDTWPNNLILG